MCKREEEEECQVIVTNLKLRLPWNAFLMFAYCYFHTRFSADLFQTKKGNDRMIFFFHEHQNELVALFFFYRMSIVSIVAREILDSRGNPTVEVDLHTGKG